MDNHDNKVGKLFYRLLGTFIISFSGVFTGLVLFSPPIVLLFIAGPVSALVTMSVFVFAILLLEKIRVAFGELALNLFINIISFVPKSILSATLQPTIEFFFKKFYSDSNTGLGAHIAGIISDKTIGGIEERAREVLEKNSQLVVDKAFNCLVEILASGALANAVKSLTLDLPDGISIKSGLIDKLCADDDNDVKTLCFQVADNTLSVRKRELESILPHIGKVLVKADNPKRVEIFKDSLSRLYESVKSDVSSIEDYLLDYTALPEILGLELSDDERDIQDELSTALFNKILEHNELIERSNKIIVASPQSGLFLNFGGVDLFEERSEHKVLNKNWNSAFDLTENKKILEQWKSSGLELVPDKTDDNRLLLKNTSTQVVSLFGLSGEVAIKPNQTVSIYLKQQWQSSDLLAMDKSYVQALEGLIKDLVTKNELLDKLISRGLENNMGRFVCSALGVIADDELSKNLLVGDDKANKRACVDRALKSFHSSDIAKSYIKSFLRNLDYSRWTYSTCEKSLLLDFSDGKAKIDCSIGRTTKSIALKSISEDVVHKIHEVYKSDKKGGSLDDLMVFISLMLELNEVDEPESIVEVLKILLADGKRGDIKSLLDALTFEKDGGSLLTLLFQFKAADGNFEKRNILGHIRAFKKEQLRDVIHSLRLLVVSDDSVKIMDLLGLSKYSELMEALLGSEETLGDVEEFIKNVITNARVDDIDNLLNLSNLDSYKQQEAYTFLAAQIRGVLDKSDHNYELIGTLEKLMSSRVKDLDRSSYFVSGGLNLGGRLNSYTPDAVKVNVLRVIAPGAEAWQASGNAGAWNLINPMFYGRWVGYSLPGAIKTISEGVGGTTSGAANLLKKPVDMLSFLSRTYQPDLTPGHKLLM